MIRILRRATLEINLDFETKTAIPCSPEAWRTDAVIGLYTRMRGILREVGNDNERTEGMMSNAPPCLEQQRLMEKVQRHLIRIAELSHAAADAVAGGNDNLVREIDNLVEHALGAKERARALRQHREEHGC